MLNLSLSNDHEWGLDQIYRLDVIPNILSMSGNQFNVRKIAVMEIYLSLVQALKLETKLNKYISITVSFPHYFQLCNSRITTAHFSDVVGILH